MALNRAARFGFAAGGERRASALVIYQIGNFSFTPRHNKHLNPDELSLKAPRRAADLRKITQNAVTATGILVIFGDHKMKVVLNEPFTTVV